VGGVIHVASSEPWNPAWIRLGTQRAQSTYIMKILGRAGVVLALVLAACAPSEGVDDGVEQGTDAVTAVAPDSPEGIVRRYYAAAGAPDTAARIAEIAADDVVLEAPSVYLLNPLGGTDKIRGKQAFVKAIAGAAFLLSSAKIAPLGHRNDPQSGVAMSVLSAPGAPRQLVVSRILLPLPNGDLLTQVEFFEIEGGKIQKLQSYYDSARFARALPAVAFEKLKQSLQR
jgi:hypothetical protein